MGQRVDFFIIGTQKGGTTALNGHLRRHPQVQMARIKEVHHFDDETVAWTQPDHGRLHRHYDWTVPGVLRGEATPISLYWPHCIARLRAYNPQARLIVSLRHPTFRAHSQWRMETRRGLETLSFEEAVSPAGRSRVTNAPNGAHRVFSYVERGFYAPQIQRLLREFPPAQVLFLRVDELWSDPSGVLATVERFLGIPAAASLAPQRLYVEAAPGALSDNRVLSAETRRKLDRLFGDDIQETARLSGLDLSAWLSPDYAEVMRASH